MEDLELKVISQCLALLNSLDSTAKERAISYINSRLDKRAIEINRNKIDSIEIDNIVESSPQIPNRNVGKTPSKHSYRLMKNLNFFPTDKTSLADFVDGFKANTYFEKNLLYIFYIRNILGIEKISIDHIYSCYRALEEKIPGNLYQSLVDTRKIKGWIDTSNMESIQLTVHGENYVNFKMQKV